MAKVKLTEALKKKGVTASMVKKVNKTGKTVMIVVEKAPSGKRYSDIRKKALKPGKRLTKNGTVYTEKRSNRSDNKGYV